MGWLERSCRESLANGTKKIEKTHQFPRDYSSVPLRTGKPGAFHAASVQRSECWFLEIDVPRSDPPPLGRPNAEVALSSRARAAGLTSAGQPWEIRAESQQATVDLSDCGFRRPNRSPRVHVIVTGMSAGCGQRGQEIAVTELDGEVKPGNIHHRIDGCFTFRPKTEGRAGL